MCVCFGGYFNKRDDLRTRGEGGLYSSRPKEEIIKEKMQLTSRLFMTSGGDTYVPDGQPGHHSPFADRFLKALTEGAGTDGYLTFHKIIEYVDKTDNKISSRSAPRYGTFGDPDTGCDFIFDKQVNAAAKSQTYKKASLPRSL